MKRFVTSLISALLFAAAPIAALADGGGSLDTGPITNLLKSITTIIDGLVPVIFAIAFIVFIWGVFTYFIAGAKDEEKLKTGRQFVMWGIIGFAVMVSVWGLVHLITDTFNFTSNTIPSIPKFSGNGT